MRIAPRRPAARRRVSLTIIEDSKTVSLVLGSSGARCLAHFSIIQWLLENGYEIAFI